MGDKDRPSCKRFNASLDYLHQATRSSRGYLELKSSRILRVRSAPSPSGVSADLTSSDHAEENLIRRAPLSHRVVCSKVVRVGLSSGFSDPGLRGRSTPFPHCPLQPVSLGGFPTRKISVVFPAFKRNRLDLKDPSN